MRRAWFALAAALSLHAAPAAPLSNAAPASLLVFPLIQVDASGTDTLIQLTHLGDGPRAVRCVYLDGSLAPGSGAAFLITLTAGQPLAWRASTGLAALPAGGNDGAVPPVPVVPFSGTLRCLASDGDGTPTAGDTLIATATIERAPPGADSATYAAVGFVATGASADATDVLVLGGDMAEYDACPESLTLQPFLDGATVELGAGPALVRQTVTTIAIATCGSAPAAGGENATIDLELTTELGTRFTARRAVREHLVSLLSLLDTAVPATSIFNSATAGSPTGNLRITPDGSGVLALIVTRYAGRGASPRVPSAAASAQMSGERMLPDLVELTLPDAPTPTPTAPPSACVGDCDGGESVAINELIIGVNIALGNSPVSACAAFDADQSGDVTINELIAAVGNALNGCT